MTLLAVRCTFVREYGFGSNLDLPILYSPIPPAPSRVGVSGITPVRWRAKVSRSCLERQFLAAHHSIERGVIYVFAAGTVRCHA
jgi:hypothetical protein